MADSCELVFDGVFDGEDVFVGGIDAIEASVERRRFSRSRRPCDEDDAVRLCDRMGNDAIMPFVEAQIFEIEQNRLLIEDTHGDALAVDGGSGGDADVDIATGDFEADSTVLWDAFFGDIETAHDLDADDDGAVESLGRTGDFFEHAIDAESEDDAIFGGFDMDIGGSLAHGLLEDHVHELDNRPLVVAGSSIEDIFDFFGFFFFARRFLRIEVFGHIGEVAAFIEDTSDEFFDDIARSEDRDGFHFRHDADDVEAIEVEWIDDSREHKAISSFEWHDELAHGDGVVIIF